MKELVIISGKGGTGKTMLTAAFAALAKDRVLCDADVDAADLHLLMDPNIKKRIDFKGGGIAVINEDKCTECGLCREMCRFDAIKENFEVDPIECEGCGSVLISAPKMPLISPFKHAGNGLFQIPGLDRWSMPVLVLLKKIRENW